MGLLKYCLICLGIFFFDSLRAANYYWVAAGSSNWNDAANWSATSGGAGGAGLPGAMDAVFFDNGSVANCGVNTSVDVGFINVTAGYTGTISNGTNSFLVEGAALFAGGIFNGGASQIFFNENLTISGSIFNSNSNLTVSGNLTITSGNLNLVGSNILIVGGNWTNYNNIGFTENHSTVIFDGAFNQTISCSNSENFFNLTVEGGGMKTLIRDIDINGVLTITNGIINTAGNAVNITATGTLQGGGIGSYISGTLNTYIAAGTNINLYFPVGNVDNYTPVSTTFSSITNAGTLHVKSTAGDHPKISSFPCTDAMKSVNNYWSINSTDLVSSSFTAVFTYGSSDVDADASFNNFNVGVYNGTGWNTLTVGSRTAVSTQVTDITTFGDFQIAESMGGYSWTGTVDSDWNNVSNWCGGIPVTTTNVTISSSSAHMPVISASAVCNNLTINNGAFLTLSASASLTIEGTFTNGGSYTNNGTTEITGNYNNTGTFADIGTVIFNGTAAQLVSGSNAFNNITVDNPNGIMLTDVTLVNGILTLTRGQIATSGTNLVVNLNTGLVNGQGSGSLSGNLTVFKNISTPSWHYFSVPLAGITADKINDNIPITNGLYYYNESVSSPKSNDGWTKITDVTTSLNQGQGYILKFPSATSLNFTGEYNHTNQNITISGTNTPSSDASADGWNFIGNPYPSPVDWELVSKGSNIDNAYYVYDPVKQQTSAFNGGDGTNDLTQYIPSMQGFHMHISRPGTGSVTFTKSSRITDHNAAIKRKAAISKSVIRLKVASGQLSDEALIRIMEDATKGFDSEHDAFKVLDKGPNPSVYTVDNSTIYSINSLPAITENMTVPLKIDVARSGTYTFSSIIPPNINSVVTLIDKKSATSQELNSNSKYTFNLDSGDTYQRFFINLNPDNITANTGKKELFNIIKLNNDNIFLDFNTNISNSTMSVQIYNVAGIQVFAEANINANTGYLIDINQFTSGIYFLKATRGNNTSTHKFVKE